MNLSFQLKRKLLSLQSDTSQDRGTDLLDRWEVNSSIYFKLKSENYTCEKRKRSIFHKDLFISE